MNMKKIMAVLGVTVAALAVLATMMPSPATAAARRDGASITKDFGCLLYDGNHNLVFTDNSHAVVTQNGGNMWCKADVAPPSAGKAVHYGPFLCGTPAGVTDQGTEVVSASGQATLKCPVR
jgi:photosystem II stability/assembly factor-like uncharacterized protein